EDLVEVLLGDRPEWTQRRDAGVGEQYVQVALLLLHRGEQLVEVREVRDVAPHAGDVPADLPDRLIEFRLAASGDEDVGALGDEPAGGGQADAAVAPGDDRDFTFQFLRHGTPPLPVRPFVRCERDYMLGGTRRACSRRLYQAEQAPRDDLPRLLD